MAFGPAGDGEPAKQSTDISLVAIDRSDAEAFALSQLIVRGVNAGLERYLQERPLFRDCCPDQELFVVPFSIFSTTHLEKVSSVGTATGPSARRPLSRSIACWPGFCMCNTVDEAGTNFTGRSTMNLPSGANC